LDAAQDCIGRAGFDGTSMKDIAVSAGVSKALVHYHFQTKDQLFLEVQAQAFRQHVRRMEELAEDSAPSPERALRGLDQVWELLTKFRVQVPLTLELWSQATRRPDLRRRVEEFNSETRALTERGLRATLGPDIDRLPLPPRRLAKLLHTMLWGTGMMAWFERDAEEADQMYADLRKLFEEILFSWEDA
jgi:AcrR family transcriptional regulator